MLSNSFSAAALTFSKKPEQTIFHFCFPPECHRLHIKTEEAGPVPAWQERAQKSQTNRFSLYSPMPWNA
jgi:hypothetical protein